MDPHIDVLQLFRDYDSIYFDSILLKNVKTHPFPFPLPFPFDPTQPQAVFVEWSRRMTLCAGTCSYRRGGPVRIALSEPLLKYRTMTDIKETLLHEMIHAWQYV